MKNLWIYSVSGKRADENLHKRTYQTELLPKEKNIFNIKVTNMTRSSSNTSRLFWPLDEGSPSKSSAAKQKSCDHSARNRAA